MNESSMMEATLEKLGCDISLSSQRNFTLLKSSSYAWNILEAGINRFDSTLILLCMYIYNKLIFTTKCLANSFTGYWPIILYIIIL